MGKSINLINNVIARNEVTKQSRYKQRLLHHVETWFAMTLIGFIILFLNSLTQKTYASSRFPISELGNCRDAKECYLYCQIPQNYPACWSYGKFVLYGKILGESAVQISYPIPELNNCASARECFNFCSQPQNQTVCQNFGTQKGLLKSEPKEITQTILESAKTDLGCDSKQACRDFCSQSENFDKCREFARKNGLLTPIVITPTPPKEFFNTAKTDLGCSNAKSCTTFCETPGNKDKCLTFIEKTGLLNNESIEKEKIMEEKKEEIIDDAKENLGCDSFESCAKFCSESQNSLKCLNLSRKFNLASTPQKANPTPGKPLDPGCRTENECRDFCNLHPQACPGFPKPSPTPVKSGSSNSSLKIIPTFSPFITKPISPAIKFPVFSSPFPTENNSPPPTLTPFIQTNFFQTNTAGISGNFQPSPTLTMNISGSSSSGSGGSGSGDSWSGDSGSGDSWSGGSGSK